MRENTEAVVCLTEAEWQAAADFGRMLNHVWHPAGARRQLLLAVALCRRIWERLPNDDCRRADCRT